MEMIDKRTVDSLWGISNVDWVYSGSIGATGGLLCMWNVEVFIKELCWGEEGALGVRGLWKREEIEVLNIYASCDEVKKGELWSILENKLREE